MASDKSDFLQSLLQLQKSIEYGDIDSAKRLVTELARQRAQVEVLPKQETPKSTELRCGGCACGVTHHVFDAGCRF